MIAQDHLWTEMGYVNNVYVVFHLTSALAKLPFLAERVLTWKILASLHSNFLGFQASIKFVLFWVLRNYI